MNWGDHFVRVAGGSGVVGKWGSGVMGWSLRARCGGKWGGGEVGEFQL
ncbi:MAG: hypothetical protein IM445_23335, partial [Microcystis sp. M015S1]|nr:hypothetical protein [Microcystis sp. M015S1]